MEEQGLRLFETNLKFVAEALTIAAPPPARWVTRNRILLDLDTMRLRDFSSNEAGARRAASARRGTGAAPVLIDAPYAGHDSTIADHSPEHSLVRTLQSSGLDRLLVTDWKSATAEMAGFDIDKYLAELNVVVDELGGAVHLVGLCQGGWMSAMYAARFPGKVRSLVLAGAPIDTHAGDGEIRRMADRLPMSFYEKIVEAGGGRMLGQAMLAGWKRMHPAEQYLGKYLDLYAHIEDESFVERTEEFERWYENPVDLPGRYYLQAIRLLFKENLLARGKFSALGRRLSLRDIRIPVYLLAGSEDDITPAPQVFGAAALLGTPAADLVSRLVPGGHIGLFMGAKTLETEWPAIGEWIAARDRMS
ncbi:alpha/beta fold hydrolase [Burkholderiaceae bacterium FT117]|nr:alpha/beta fold hydrolase [Zeimonas sediminis]MCM5569446.1 alpha/beta fold hydrolase [Zeimonas sediminis]